LLPRTVATPAPTSAIAWFHNTRSIARNSPATTAATRLRSGLAENYEPVFGLLPQLRCPAMLIHGRDDLVAAPAAVAEFARQVPGARIAMLARSGHMGYQEQPAEYCAAVTEFVLAQQRATAPGARPDCPGPGLYLK
jgi:pimeloyl-ACP methyl ester carboxylesterase